MRDDGLTGAQSRSEITLHPITAETVRTICLLKVRPDQERFVAPNAVSIAEAYFERERAWFRAIYAGDVPVGFLMLADDPEEPRYFLWRFMIDAGHQGNGFGRKAIGLLIDYVRTRPGATELLTSCVPGEGSPRGFYEGLGFVYTGQDDEDEQILRLEL